MHGVTMKFIEKNWNCFFGLITEEFEVRENNYDNKFLSNL